MKKIISIILCLTLLAAPCLSIVACAEETAAPSGDYTIVSPYSEVIWEGDDAWGAYKGSLHSHTTYSDASVDLATMVKEYYNQDYDFLANSDHGVTGVEWNRAPKKVLLYSYQKLLGYETAHLTDEEYEGITTGTYPLYDGTVRGSHMTCVVGANELNNMTLTKSHVNAFFIPEDVGNGYGGWENGYEDAVKFTQKHGGLSIINHPGDWLESRDNISTVSKEKNIQYFGNILLKYDSCLGIEVFNETNSVTPFDRILWDNLLMYTLPYGKNVIGFSNTDAHTIENIDSSFNIYMMEENNVENIKETMQTGTSFMVTRNLPIGNDIIGPAEGFDVRNSGIPYPVFTKVAVNGHKITVKAENAQTVQFIANGEVIYKGEIGSGDVTLDLDTIEGAENFQYVRAEVFGEGGMCLTQALVIDDGGEAQEYEQAKGILPFIKKVIFTLKSSRLWVIIVEIYRMAF
ncbi:MAG: hypothetical protein IJZ16_14540 [Clostridia bacterium]|nr:hypothetical protein [Clostridia bacterium]